MSDGAHLAEPAQISRRTRLLRRASRLRKPGYLGARALAHLGRRAYGARIEAIAERPVPTAPPVGAEVWIYSCERDVPELVANAHSFLEHVGVPERFVVVSDGTHAARSRRLLERLHNHVEVIDMGDLLTGDLSAAAREYAQLPYWQAHKLAYQMALPVRGPTFCFDTDVLFFPGARMLAGPDMLAPGAPWYLRDCLNWMDPALVPDGTGDEPVNGGAYVLHRRLDWDAAVAHFERAGKPWSYYVDQTLLHIAIHASGGRRLPEDRFIMRLDDEFSARDRYASPDIALRHYAGVVRYKLWCRLGPTVLNGAAASSRSAA